MMPQSLSDSRHSTMNNFSEENTLNGVDANIKRLEYWDDLLVAPGEHVMMVYFGVIFNVMEGKRPLLIMIRKRGAGSILYALCSTMDVPRMPGKVWR